MDTAPAQWLSAWSQAVRVSQEVNLDAWEVKALANMHHSWAPSGDSSANPSSTLSCVLR